jgi:SAM-dependent methyltransferase
VSGTDDRHTPWLPPLSANAWLRYDAVRRVLPNGIRDVLEIGCGRGGFAARLARKYRYVGLEPDPLSYAVAREYLARSGGRGEVRNGDVSQVGADERFDLVCAFEVIEHLEDDRLALERWIAHLRPGGWLLLTTPAWQHRFGAADALVGHVRRYDPPILREMMRSAGLTEIETRLYGGPLGYVLEVGRDLVAQLGARVTPGSSRAERTAGSGRWLQPRSDRAGFAVRVGTAPFRRLQGVLPDTGPGLVAIARLPLT